MKLIKKAQSSTAPRLDEPQPRFSLDPAAAAEALARAYYQASLAGADMAAAAEILEPLRAEYRAEDYHHTWDAVDRWIGINDDAVLAPILAGLRELLVERVARGEIARLRQVFRQDSTQGWLDWLYALAAAIVNWRGALGRRLAAARLPFTPAQEAQRAEILRGYRAVQSEEWMKAVPLFDRLIAEDSLPALYRARLGMFAAQVYLYHQIEFEHARQYLEAAAQLAAEDALVLTGWGEYWLQQQDYEKARQHLQQAIRRNPARSEAYADLGDSYDRQDDLDTAAEWYREAVKNAPDSSQGYVRLIRLFGRPELIGQHEDELDALVEKAVAVDPESAGSTYLELAYLYQQNKRYQQAYALYDRVIAVDPDLVDGPVWKAYAQMEEALYAEAEATLTAALQRHPASDTVAGALEALALKLYTEAKQDEPALRIYRLLRERRGKRYEMTYANLVANLRYYHGDYAAAAEGYRRAIVLRPKDAVLRSNLALALESLRAPGRRREEVREAARLLENALELGGENEEYTARLRALRLEERLLGALGEERLAQTPVHEPVTVYTSSDLVPRYADAERKLLYPHFLEKVEAMRARVRAKTGVTIPGVMFRDLTGTATDYYYLCLNEDWVEYRTMPAGAVFLPLGPGQVAPAGVEGQPEDPAITGRAGLWLDALAAGQARAAGLEVLDPLDYLLAHLEAMLTRNLAEVETLQSVYWRAAEALPDQIPALRAEPGKLVDVAVIFKALEAEGVPLNPYPLLVSTVLRLRTEGLTRQEVAERLRALPEVRGALPGADHHRLPLGAELEELITARLVESAAGPVLALRREDLDQAAALLPGFDLAGPTALTVTRPGLRAAAARLIHTGFPTLPVLAESELAAETA